MESILMGKIKFIFVIVFCLLFLDLIIAPSTLVQTSSSSNGLTIKYPDEFIIKQSKDYNFNFHIYNTSDGMPINSTLTCSFHLYDSQGVHIYFTSNYIQDNLYDYEVLIKGNNFSTTGEYYYLFQCNQSSRGGFVNAPLEVTVSGLDLTTARAIIYFIFIMVLIFAFILSVMGAVNVEFSNIKNLGGEIIGINWGKYIKILLVVISYFLLLFIFGGTKAIMENYLVFNSLSKTLNLLYNYLWALLYPTIVVSILVVIISIVTDKKILNELERGLKAR